MVLGGVALLAGLDVSGNRGGAITDFEIPGVPGFPAWGEFGMAFESVERERIFAGFQKTLGTFRMDLETYLAVSRPGPRDAELTRKFFMVESGMANVLDFRKKFEDLRAHLPGHSEKRLKEVKQVASHHGHRAASGNFGVLPPPFLLPENFSQEEGGGIVPDFAQ